MSSQIPMTQEGYDRINDEIEELERQRPAIKAAIAEARDKGDLRENADYHAAREALGMLDAKQNLLRDKLVNAVIVDPSKIPDGIVALFRTVTVKRLKDGKPLVRTIVGEGDADPAAGKITATSPIGKALIGKKVGDVATAILPAGPVEMKIMKIE